jgi:hypothetical protein
MGNETSLSAFLGPEEIVEIQAHLMQLLSEDILYYTHGQSSSVSVEKAQSLFESMLYCITAYLNTLPDPQNTLKTCKLDELYLKGLALVKQYVNDAQLLLAEAKLTRIPTDLIAYNHTIDCEIGMLLEGYDPRFQAQNTTALSATANISYPLLKDDLSVTGIIYIKNYLTQLIAENKLCSNFAKNYIRSVLFTYGAKHHLDYREMLVNIPQLILEQQKSAQ